MKTKRLSRSFYLRDTLIVAPALLGKIFVLQRGRSLLTGLIVEVEAYLRDDPASHSFRGMTERNSVMFWKGGHLYVYFTYGMHFCANIVTGAKGTGEAILIRAVEPISGIPIMKRRREMSTVKNVRQLTNGPAKFAQAFGITREHSGIDLCTANCYILDSPVIPSHHIIQTTRIGISTAREMPWRWYIKDNPWVSKK